MTHKTPDARFRIAKARSNKTRLGRAWHGQILPIAFVACLHLPFASLAGAQTVPASPPSHEKLVSQGLDPTPFAAEALGLTLNLPAGTQVITEKVDGNLVLNLADDHKAPTWSIRIQQMESTAPKPSAQIHIDDLLADLGKRKEHFEVIANQAFVVKGLAGHLCYLKRTSPQGEAYVGGWLILPTGERSFMVFSIQSLPEHFSRLRSILEASFATIQLRSAQELASDRASRFEAGRAMLESITEDQLRALVGTSQWHRIYRPVDEATGAVQDIGYTLVEVIEAKKGSTTGRPESTFTRAENELGILVRVQARLVVDAQNKDFFDSIATYWMAWDQSEEIWSIRATRRQGEAERSESETGVREPQTAGSPRPRVTVVKRTDTTDPVSYEWEVPSGYMSQALGWLIGRLLPRDQAGPREFANYFFVSSSMTPKIYERIDRWEPLGDGSGNWKLNSQFTSNSPPFYSIYAPDGRMVKRVHSDGTVTLPIDLEELQKIWKSKGLQIGGGRR